MGYFLGHNTGVDCYSMKEASELVGNTREAIRRRLQREGVPLEIKGNACFVNKATFDAYVADQGGLEAFRVGRPRKPAPDPPHDHQH